ncbi:plasmid partitioning protein RepB C-terminal domain-containing protein [Bradyrhizobium japonicum]|jgi:ParB family transcriptional regulator, chromosome partitioning protein|uniref:plasmid partitioning protein RepB C-terminal domain-containing protein n=1 Tax=Bradyrhizobium japonicum TaxID=375 RepID=UPI000412425B|nr:plasmid partitioning protein RepB C-terminal domain-containing protein [Bradyrhizobium japonicum]
MAESSSLAVQIVPISQVSVVNPRIRNKKSFRELVENIAALGLKKPITVTKREEHQGVRYDLVCGQGRLEAFMELGASEIPALVIEASVEDCMVKSLVENCARRQHHAIDLLHDIGGMKQRGYTDAEIAKKTGLSLEYVRGVGRLLAQGEQRLLRAVEAGHIPVSVAVQIADADDIGIQEALHQAYERNLLRGRKLMIVKRIVESRRRRGRAIRGSGPKEMSQRLSSRTLLRAYKEDTDRKRLLIRKADATRNRLLFIAHAMRELFGDERFVSLLKAEKLDSVPKKLLGRMERGDVG